MSRDGMSRDDVSRDDVSRADVSHDGCCTVRLHDRGQPAESRERIPRRAAPAASASASASASTSTRAYGMPLAMALRLIDRSVLGRTRDCLPISGYLIILVESTCLGITYVSGEQGGESGLCLQTATLPVTDTHAHAPTLHTAACCGAATPAQRGTKAAAPRLHAKASYCPSGVLVGVRAGLSAVATASPWGGAAGSAPSD